MLFINIQHLYKQLRVVMIFTIQMVIFLLYLEYVKQNFYFNIII